MLQPCALSPRSACAAWSPFDSDQGRTPRHRSAACDVLLDGDEWYEFPAPRIHTVHTHGTGCVYSAAITAEIAAGAAIPNAVARAKTFVWEAIRVQSGVRGPGFGAGESITSSANHSSRRYLAKFLTWRSRLLAPCWCQEKSRVWKTL